MTEKKGEVANIGFAKVAVQCSADTFVVNQTLVLRINICGEKSPPSPSPKPFAFAVYFIGFSLFVLPISAQIDGLDYFAIGLFIIGCVLNSGGEILRNEWKKKPENKGKIYTNGFFKYSRHINYFGDIFWVIAYALITKKWYSILIPIFLFSFFAFYNAPKLDKYLKNKYGKGYDEYVKMTKKLIPFMY